MVPLLLAGVVAQGLDAVTMHPHLEANALIVALGPTAYLAKIVLILGVTLLALALPRLPSGWRQTRCLQRPTALLVSATLLAVGEFGAISNLLASGLL